MSDVTIVGGGIIGVCTGIALLGEGLSVELVDRGILTAGASYGNCGLLAVGEVVPISKPGILSKIPKWLLDPESPLFVRPRGILTQMPWLLRFLWSGRRGRVLEIADALASLTRRAEDDYQQLFEKTGIINNLVRAQNIMAFNSKADYEDDQFSWNLRQRLGFKHQFLSKEELLSLEPALGGPIKCGVLLEEWFQFSDPGLVQQRLTQFFVAQGGQIRTGSVERIEAHGNKAVAIHLGNGEKIPVQRLALCAGAWSRKLARDLSVRVPLAALQGYHHHVPNPGVKLNRPILYANGGFVLTPMESGLRIAGTIEIAGIDPHPDYRRANIIARKATQVLPGLDISGGKQWMGPRPFMPDTLPVIDRAPHHDNVVFAFGHGQIGMTLGPTTAKIASDLLIGRSPELDLSPYRVTRF
ncbi:FAD-binding oxidoreductase (plasmid) [Rhizobium sp. CB3171]|uniref:NAD(P)/FAD-dependent oxidoreductase n=1 Tax=Rhizobium sp. CB3171 TaxID=3039157 RepID=UPI0024B06AF0|nr:FAD-binding oxidoreductase [Rhizobium sp. CB3171]WFU07246.1 FAD-binding oxidoreductase [Rhizobium sp. CB3171]